MLKKIALFLLALMLLPCALAEDAPVDMPEENPFLGTWEVLYYIQDGRPLTEEENQENPVMFIFTEERIELLFQDESTESTAYARDGAVCTVDGLTFTLEHEDLIVGNNPYVDLSFLLVRIDPMVLNNPFIGTWEVLVVVDFDGTVEDMSDYYQAAAVAFEKDALLIIDGDDVQRVPCTYADGQCTAVYEGANITVTILADGLLEMQLTTPDTSESGLIICAKEGEVVSEDVSQFYGLWREIALVYNGQVTTDAAQAAYSTSDNFLFTYDFTRAAVRRIFPDDLADYSSWILCSYQDGACTMYYTDSPALCTIDANGLMCIRTEDGSAVSWLVRVEEESETLTASAQGLLSDVTVTITRDAKGVITTIQVDASGETQAIAKPCTEEAFLSQFLGKAGPFTDIDVVSGATFTSEAVINAVNSLYAD